MKELARRILPALSEHQRRLAAACVLEYADSNKVTADHLTAPRLEKYLKAYFADPLAVVRKQNDFIRGLQPEDRKPFFRAAPLLNYYSEREAHTRPYVKPNESTHDRLENVGYLFHGDLLPGTYFRMGDESSVSREYLKMKKESESTLKYTPYTRQLVAGNENNTETRIAEILMHALREKGGPKHEPAPGEFVGPATMVDRGDDVCRHKSPLLALCLQEAGINARCVRGEFTGVNKKGRIVSGRHVWVEAKLDGKYFRLDPQWSLFLPLEQSRQNKNPTKENPVYAPHPNTNVVWRRKRIR